MNWDDYKARFEREALNNGLSTEFVARCLAYAAPLAVQGVPIIYDFAHLSALLGFQEVALKESLLVRAELYTSYFIPKRSAGYRRIDEPKPSLRKIQEWILRFILDRCIPHAAATAFYKGRSIKLNAEPHLNQPMVLSLDIKNFFGSISVVRVGRVFRQLGYASDVADALALLTTFRSGLPQGAPTSPALSNLAMVTADETLAEYAAGSSIRYSRYADDMTFSGRFRPGFVISFVRRVLAARGLVLNEAKTRLMLRHQRQEVTGVVVNERLQAPRWIRRALRQETYYIRHFGHEAHHERRPSVYENHLGHLRGLAEFVVFLNPNDRDARTAIDVLGSIVS
jgi:RNA-directed DNA polymerase